MSNADKPTFQERMAAANLALSEGRISDALQEENLARLYEAGFTDAIGEKRLSDGLAAGVIFGLTWNGALTSIDQNHQSDGLDASWWDSQMWSVGERRSFSDWLKYKLKATEHQVILGAHGPEDEVNKIVDLQINERERWYRLNVFNDPSAITWPIEGLYISDAVMASRKDAKERTPEEDEHDLGMLHTELKHGIVLASGEKRRPGGTRILIPIIEFETLNLHWKTEVISDGLELTYYDARIHQRDALPAKFKNLAKKHVSQYRSRNRISDHNSIERGGASDDDKAKFKWGANDWLDEEVRTNQRLRERLSTDRSYIGDYVFDFDYEPWADRVDKEGLLPKIQRLKRKTFRNAAGKLLI